MINYNDIMNELVKVQPMSISPAIKAYWEAKLNKMSSSKSKHIIQAGNKHIKESKIFNLAETLLNVFKVSKKERKSLVLQMVKLGEETGELSAAVLMHLGKKGTRMSKSEITENVLEEACDCLLMILSILNKAGFNEKEINEMINKKLKKWEDRLGK